MARQIRFAKVSFSFPDLPEEIFNSVSFTLGEGWTGIVGANGAGKSTLLRLARGELLPTAGVIEAPRSALYAPQLAEAPPEELEEFMNDWDPPALDLKERLQIEYDWLFRWDTLSQGERKRCQLALVLWRDPPLLAVDEPTNHLDQRNRELITQGLASYDGVGLLVSHDRPLLDALTRRTLVVHAGGVLLRNGTFSAARKEELWEREEVRRERVEARRSNQKLLREYRRREREAQKRSRGFSKAGLAPKDSDGRAAVDLARLTGKDKRAGELKKQLHKRLADGQERLDELAVTPAVLSREGGLILEGSDLRRDRLFTLSGGEIPLGEERRLLYPELTMKPGDRVHLSGPNGAGKSTLLRKIVAAAEEERIPFLYLPQELGPRERSALATAFASLDSSEEGRVLATVHWLGSDPERIRDGESWSPGEERKLHFALGALREPALFLLDEPTNHLDLPAVMALERALGDVESAILLVSHDEQFAESVTAVRWEIDGAGEIAIRDQ